MDSFKDCYERYVNTDRYTNYERERGITVVQRKVLDFSDSFKAVLNFKSDGDVGIILFFNGSIKNPYWFYWYPNDEQMLLLDIVKDMYFRVDKHNKRNKNIPDIPIC